MAANQIVNILGELVSLDDKETGLSPGDPILVPFTSYYVHPDFTDGDKTTLKQAFQKVFKTSVEPLPPCEKKEKELIIKSLTYRFSLLRKILLENSKDSKAFRVAAEHAFRLKAYLEFFEQTAECSDAGAESKLSRIEPLDDAMIQALIRQFVFLILQGENPLEKYQGADPNPKQFIQRLNDGKLENFDEFLGDYRAENLPIAARLAKLLEVSELDLDAIQKLIDEGIQKKMDEVIKKIKETVGNDPMFVGANWGDLYSIFDKLLEKIKVLENELKTLKEKEGTAQQQHTASQGQLQEKEELNQSLKEQITKIEAELKASQAAAAKCSTNSDTAKKAQESAQIEIDKLKSVLEKSTKDYQDLLLRIPSLEAEIKRLHDEITRLEGVVTTLRAPGDELAKVMAELDDVKKQLNDEKIRSADLERQLNAVESRLRKECDDAKKILTDQYEQRIAKKEKELDDLKTTSDTVIAAKQKGLDDLKTTFQDYKTGSIKTVTDKDEELKKVKAALDEELEKVKAALQKEINQGSSNRGAATSYVGELETKATEALNTINALTIERDTLKEELKKCAGLQNIIDQLKIDNQNLSDKIVSLDQEIVVKTQEIETLKEQLRNIGGTFCRDLQDQLTQLQNNLNTLNQEVNQLKAQNELLEANETANEEEIQKLNDEKASLQTSLNNTQGELEATKGTLQEKEGVLANTQGELEATNKELQEKQEELEAITTVKEEEEEGRSRLKEEYTTLQAERETTKQEKADLESKYNALVNEKDQIVSDYENLLAENTALKSQIEQLKTENQELEEKLRNIGNGCDAKDAEITRLTNILNEKVRKNKEALEQLKLLKQEIEQKGIETQEELEKVRVEKVAALAEADRKKNEELDALRKQHGDLMAKTASDLALWITKPNFPSPFDTGPFAPVVQTIKTLIQTKNDEIKRLSVQQDPVKAKAEATSRHCYMLFFAAHTMSVHFPTYDERQMNVDKNRISEYIQNMLYGVFSGQIRNIIGLFEEDLITKDKTTFPERKLLDVLIKLLNSMENYYDSKETSEKEQSSLDSEKEILDLITKKVKDVLTKKRISIKEFQSQTATYMNVRLGENGGHVERVYYYRNNDGKSMIGTPGDVEVIMGKDPKYTLTFPICFYLFLFTMKEYFNRIEGDLTQCPIPMILKRKGREVNNIKVQELR